MPRPLDLEGELRFESDSGDVFRLDFERDTVVLSLPDLRVASQLLRVPPRPSRKTWLKRAHKTLLDSGLGLSIRVGGETIGLLGVPARSGLLSRCMGLAPLDVKFPALLRQLVRRGTSASPREN